SMLIGALFLITAIFCMLGYAGSFVIESAVNSFKTEQTSTVPSKYINADGTMNAEAVLADTKAQEPKKQ
ncbi:hypothetical protein, partial [Burkholderia cenocepacia]|uniref:hypothetical protein n=1 Tax=Burkholderia cenocepacia TaxID=95486 RepID=UPI001C0E2180